MNIIGFLKNIIYKNSQRKSEINLKSGSMTVEAAIALPLLILAIWSLLYIIQIVVIHNTMQTALTCTAYEAGQYVTAYVKAGIDEEAEQAFNLVYRLMLNLNKNESEGETDPLQYDKPVMEFFVSILKQKFQDELADIVFREMIKKYLVSSGIAEETLMYARIVNGLNGLDFTDSEVLSDKRTIKLVMKYQIQPPIRLGKLSQLNMQNTAMIIPWQDGLNANSNPEEPFSAWVEMSPIDRGSYIMEHEIVQILQQNKDEEVIIKNTAAFKVGVLNNNSDIFKEIINIRSIDYSLNSYQNKETFIEAVLNEIIAVGKPERYKDKQKVRILKTDDNTKRTMIMVLPEGTVKPNKALEECFDYATSNHVTLIVKYAYGRPMYDVAIPEKGEPEDAYGMGKPVNKIGTDLVQ